MLHHDFRIRQLGKFKNSINNIMQRRVCLFASENGNRIITMGQDFFVGYRKTKIQPNEVLLFIDIPFTREVVPRETLIIIAMERTVDSTHVCTFACMHINV